jgi:nucleotide-binding universal stress UspA family protein
MKTILVATDFSTRSDRALRRASMLAKQHGARLEIVHVVDDDRAEQLVANEREGARGLLDALAADMTAEGLDCRAGLYMGAAVSGVTRAADELEADLIVVGPHRRDILKDVFTGTTVDRIIRHSRRPVLMANTVPAGSYSRVLIGVDMSPGAANAVSVATGLGLLRGVQVGIVHAFSAPAYKLMIRTSVSSAELKAYIEGERARAKKELAKWRQQVGLQADFEMLELPELSTANLINECARLKKAELIVIGSKGTTGLEKVLLGSVAEDVLKDARVDVLTVPSA